MLFSRVYGLTLLMVALCLSSLQSQTIERPEPLLQARVDFVSDLEWEHLKSVAKLDIMQAKPGEFVRIIADAEQLGDLRSLGLSVTIEIEDIQKYYAARISGENFGAYHTFAEVEEFLDDLHAGYPLITAKTSIGTTHEMRDVWAIKISDNPEVEETEPEVLIDGLHHPGEIITPEVVFHYMLWLCENYGTDPEATFLVDNREIWFVPVVNPDGLVWLETLYPEGGGYVRFNRGINEYGSIGVDLNRNYPFMWGTGGSVYIGTSPGSEPEVQAMMNLMKQHDFVAYITFHSVIGSVLLPWGYTEDQPPHDWLLKRWGKGMTRYNGYEYGQASRIFSQVSGSAKDYAYGEQEDKNMILSCTLEVAGSGSWPWEHEIPLLNEECLWPQIYTTWAAGPYLEVAEVSFMGGGSDGIPGPGDQLELIVTVENQSLFEDVPNASITLSSDDPYVRLHHATTSIGDVGRLSFADNSENPFTLSIDPAMPSGHVPRIVINLTGDEFERQELIDLPGDEPLVLFFDDMESGADKWETRLGRWGLTTAMAHSGSTSYTCSPYGDYKPSESAWIKLAEPLDLSGIASAKLTFWHHYNMAEVNDACYVQVSNDGWHTWEDLGPAFRGRNGNWFWWFRSEFSLDDYAGSENFSLRFRRSSDLYHQGDGWYVDDVQITGYPLGNVVPSCPTLVSPPDGGVVENPPPTLIVSNSHDPDSEAHLTYGFSVYRDEELTDLVTSGSGIAEGATITQWIVDVDLADGTYWWRAYADDSIERGAFMPAATFHIGVAPPELASRVVLLNPAPNPLRDETVISFELPERTRTKIRVYDIQGREICTVLDEEAGPGPVTCRWDGQAGNGQYLASGIYVLRLRTSESADLRTKLVLTR